MLMSSYDKIDDIKRVYTENERLKNNQLSESISFQEIISMKLNKILDRGNKNILYLVLELCMHIK